MKCERCGNPTKWVGSLMSGHLECEHCANDDACAQCHDEYMEAQINEARVQSLAGNPLKCPNNCCMQGGNAYCSCYGEMPLLRDDLKAPSIQDDPRFIIEPKRNACPVFSRWDEYQRAMEIYMAARGKTIAFPIELKGEFKC